MAETYTGEAYCVKCKEKRHFTGEVKISDSGRRMAQGTCPKCGTKVNGSSARPEQGPSPSRSARLRSRGPLRNGATPGADSAADSARCQPRSVPITLGAVRSQHRPLLYPALSGERS